MSISWESRHAFYDLSSIFLNTWFTSKELPLADISVLVNKPASCGIKFLKCSQILPTCNKTNTHTLTLTHMYGTILDHLVVSILGYLIAFS